METKLLFAAKFGELEAQYARLEQRFALCRAGDRESIRQECELLADECMAWENALLYAEYALDAAAQAMRHALMAALYATGLQMDAEQDRITAVSNDL